MRSPTRLPRLAGAQQRRPASFGQNPSLSAVILPEKIHPVAYLRRPRRAQLRTVEYLLRHGFHKAIFGMMARRHTWAWPMEVARVDSHEAELQRIIAQIAAGDRAAEADLINRFQRGVTLLARKYARPNESRIADIVQTVLMNTLERLRLGALREAAALPGYLRTCVINEVTMMYRDRNTTSDEDISAADGKIAELTTSDTPELRASRAQLLRNVVHAIDSLPVPRDRELLVRFYLREESREEVCAALRIDESHFRRVLHRARERLHDLLGAAA